MAAVPASIAGGAAAGRGPKARVLASADAQLDALLDGGICPVLAPACPAEKRGQMCGRVCASVRTPADVRAVSPQV